MLQPGRRSQLFERLAVPQDMPARQRILAGNAGKTGRFTRAVGADQRHAFSGGNVKAHAIDRMDAAKIFHDLLNLQHQRAASVTR